MAGTFNSIVEIWNLALGRVGHKDVKLPTEISTEADLLRKVWPVARDASFELYDWGFSRRYLPLGVRLDGEETDGWAFAFQYPAGEVMSVRRVTRVGVGDEVAPIPFSPSVSSGGGDMILLNEDGDDLRVVCSVRVIDPARYSAAFISSIAYTLASEIVAVLSKNPRREQMAIQLGVRAGAIASAASATQERARKQRKPAGIAARA